MKKKIAVVFGTRPEAIKLCPMPKFSIIIPVYNVAPYLRECLDSVVAAVVCPINWMFERLMV